MNQQFQENGFLVIKNFITKKRAKDLSKKFIQYCKENPEKCTSDLQVPNTPAKHNHIPFLEILCEKTPEISKVLGEFVLPTYTYSRIYKNGDTLKKHLDRDSCEISLTIHLNSDEKWEFFLEDLTGKIQSIILNSGDALLYSGCTVPHWREEYTGNFYSQVFLHYVKSNGERNGYYFDNGKNYSKNLEDYINVFENVISTEICDKIISEYENSGEWGDAMTATGVYKEIRNCKLIDISKRETIIKNENIRQKIDNELYGVVSNIFCKMNNKYKNISASKDSGYTLLKYDVGGFYVEHTDNHSEYPRTLSCSLCLNDDYEGGEFGFFNGKLKYKLKKGSAIVFPSNFMYPHEIMQVKKGVRYSIITWFN